MESLNNPNNAVQEGTAAEPRGEEATEERAVLEANQDGADQPGVGQVAAGIAQRVEKSAVWFTGQQTRTEQRDPARYVEESFAHPGKMLPHVTRSIINTYGEPGAVWLDPMCGIGTTLVEAVTFGYTVYGVEWEPRWVNVCNRNLQLLKELGFTGQGFVSQGDARKLRTIYPDIQVDRIAFSPPYGNTLSKTSHGPDKHPERQKGGKRAAKAIRHGYGFTGIEEAAIPDQPGEMSVKAKPDEINLGDLKHGNLDDAISVTRLLLEGQTYDPKVIKPSYLTEMSKVYHQCFQALKVGGVMILVLRDYRRDKRRVDLLGDTLDVCEEIGFQYHDRSVALQCPVDVQATPLECSPEGHLGFWTIQNCKDQNPPVMIPVFEDILVLRKDSDKPKKSKHRK